MQRWTETPQIFSLCRGFAAVVLNRSIALAPIVRPLISSPRACGLAPRSNKNRLEGWFRSRRTVAREYPKRCLLAATCWKSVGRWHLFDKITSLVNLFILFLFFGTFQTRLKDKMEECPSVCLPICTFLGKYPFANHFPIPSSSWAQGCWCLLEPLPAVTVKARRQAGTPHESPVHHRSASLVEC